MTNAQAALMAAATSFFPDTFSISTRSVFERAEEYKKWLDGQDRQDPHSTPTRGPRIDEGPLY